MTHAEWLTAPAAKPSEITARPTTYNGTNFRSELEAGWAATLDHLSIKWAYEQSAYRLPSGAVYVPDLWLPAIRTFIEVKGTHAHRIHKPNELAQEVDDGVIVLIGWPPLNRSLSPYQRERFLVWSDPLGYDTRLARCQECSQWQWLRAQLSRNCRACGTFHTGLLARQGEIQYHRAVPDRPSWMGAH